MKKRIILPLILLLFVCTVACAQADVTKALIWSAARGLEYKVKAGFNIGGTAPVPLPAEIRSIESYNPTLSIAIEGNVTKWICARWGVETGIRFETKGMKTDARVKNYNMEMIDKDGGYMKGRWTGFVKTKVNNTYITVPVLAVYKISSVWRMQGGFFFSYMTDGEFAGDVYDGYLRNGDPTGTKVFIDEATYDFSDNLRKFQWGAQLGGEWKAFRHFALSANLTWGFRNIFEAGFETITFNMYPIYMNVGFGYTF